MWMARQRARLRARAESYRALADGHIPDGMLDTQVEHKVLHSLPAVISALERMEQGTYGICVNCHTEIPQARLASIPAAARCIDCERAREEQSWISVY